ncbi:MAG: pyrroline-5-carboxylate reductase [Oscillospiraceae bacterium]|jgi:pyrroline-5-carboxylate reductase|nr:pyrroline-5-carboxylate reductase [Oscillospiraceae bacterium]
MGIRWASIGTGKMAYAIFSRAAQCGHIAKGEICFADCDTQRLAHLSSQGYIIAADNREAARAADLIMLGVRPRQVSDALAGISEEMRGKTLVSIAAGISSAFLRSLLPPSASVVRLMPNLPMLVGCGACALALPASAPAAHLDDIRALLRCSGELYELPEERINAVTALSGSGPGYFFRIASVMCGQAEEMGIDRATAQAILSQTMLGAARMLAQSAANPSDLAREVAVVGGTTEAAFAAFDKHSLDTAIAEGMRQCAARAAELGQ